MSLPLVFVIRARPFVWAVLHVMLVAAVVGGPVSSSRRRIPILAEGVLSTEIGHHHGLLAAREHVPVVQALDRRDGRRVLSVDDDSPAGASVIGLVHQREVVQGAVLREDGGELALGDRGREVADEELGLRRDAGDGRLGDGGREICRTGVCSGAGLSGTQEEADWGLARGCGCGCVRGGGGQSFS